MRIFSVVLTAVLLSFPSAAGARGFPHGGWLDRSLPTGDTPIIFDHDAATDTFYVANAEDGTVSVLDRRGRGRSRALAVGGNPAAVLVFGRTLYVTDPDNPRLIVVDLTNCNARDFSGCASAVRATVPYDGAPFGMAADAVSGTVYAGDFASDQLFVIDARTCNRAVISGCAPVARAFAGPAVATPYADPATRTLYAPSGDKLAVIDMRACNARAVAGCATPAALAEAGLVPVTATIDGSTLYVANQDSWDVSLFDARRCNALDVSGCTEIATTESGPVPYSGLAAAPGTLYVADNWDTVTVIDTRRCRVGDTSGCGQRWKTIQTGNEPQWMLGVDDTLYVSDALDDELQALDMGSCNAFRTVGCRAEEVVDLEEAENLSADESVHTVYVSAGNLHQFSLFDSRRCSVAARCTPRSVRIDGISGPFATAVDESTHTLYVTNIDDRDVVLIDTRRCNVSRVDGCTVVGPHIPVGVDPTKIAVNPVTHAVYVLNLTDATLQVIDGRRCRIGDTSRCVVAATQPVMANPQGVVADPATNTVYVSGNGANNDNHAVLVIDGSRCCAVRGSITVGRMPQGIDVDPARRVLYVANFNDGDGVGEISVVDTRRCWGRDVSGCQATPVSVPVGRGPVALRAVDGTVFVTGLTHSSLSILRGCDARGCRRPAQDVAAPWLPLQLTVADGTVFVLGRNRHEIALVAAG